jgi:hypothetical protein
MCFTVCTLSSHRLNDFALPYLPINGSSELTVARKSSRISDDI